MSVTRCRVAPNKLRPFRLTTEVFSVETNEKVNETYSSIQAPKVENKTIVIDDYSTHGGSGGRGLKLWRQVEALRVPHGSSVCLCSSDHADPEAGWVRGHGSLPPAAARVSVSARGAANLVAQ